MSKEVCTVCGGEIPHSTYKWLTDYESCTSDEIFQKAVIFTYLFGEDKKAARPVWNLSMKIQDEERIIPTKYYLWKSGYGKNQVNTYSVCGLCAIKGYNKCFNCGEMYTKEPDEDDTMYDTLAYYGADLDYMTHLPFCNKFHCNEMKEYCHSHRKYKGYTKLMDSIREHLIFMRYDQAKDSIVTGLLEYNIEQSRKRN